MEADPYQMRNLCNQVEHAAVQARLDAQLERKLAETNDKFLPGPKYIEQFGYQVDATGTVPYTP